MIHEFGQTSRQRVEIALVTDRQDRQLMFAELAQGQHLEKFIKGSQPARQGQKGVRQLNHPLFAHLHVGNDFQARQSRVAHFAIEQHARDHTDHLAAGGQRGIGQRTHHADPSAPIDDRGTGPREPVARKSGERHEPRIGTIAGSAKHANHECAHE